MRFLFYLLLSLFPFCALASTPENEFAEQKGRLIQLKVNGFIKNDFFYDTRQVIAAREGHFLLWPSPRQLDAFGNDLNAKASFNFLAIQTRLRLTITGPDVLEAKLTGVIEGDFFASTNVSINMLRLRHAFIKLNWEKTELLTGQYWNPMFVTDCFPGTVSFNTGVPTQALARNPQIRVTHSISKLKLIVAAMSQRDFVNTGPIGPSSSYLRNAILPELHGQIHWQTKRFLIGTGISYKQIVPRLSSTVDQQTYKVSESVSGISALIFAKVKTNPVTLKMQARYGENNTDLLTIGGYAVTKYTNQETQERAYTPFTNASYWLDVHTNSKKLQVGLFAGVVHNLGLKDALSDSFAEDPIIYGFGHNINRISRISPRGIYTFGKLQLALEAELTIAEYGQQFDQYRKSIRVDRVENCRVLTSIIFNF